MGVQGVRRVKKADLFYMRAAWRKLRLQALERDHYTCQDCLAEYRAGHMHRPRQATMVHHIKTKEDRPDLALDIENLVSLCDDCHAKRHPEKGSGARPGEGVRGVSIIKI
jgi:5-methylcytosine-specific restriction protein A